MNQYTNGSILRRKGRDAKIRNSLLKLLPNLNEREQYVVKLRLGIDLKEGKIPTLEEIGKQLDCTRERVRQIQNEAFEKLRQLGLKIN